MISEDLNNELRTVSDILSRRTIQEARVSKLESSAKKAELVIKGGVGAAFVGGVFIALSVAGLASQNPMALTEENPARSYIRDLDLIAGAILRSQHAAASSFKLTSPCGEIIEDTTKKPKASHRDTDYTPPRAVPDPYPRYFGTEV